MNTATPRKNRAPLNLAMGWIGLAGTVAMSLAHALDWPMTLRVISVLTVLTSLATMFFTRKSDEYTLGLWSSGANAAFALIVAMLIFGPFVEGVYDGYMQAHDGTERERDITGDSAPYLALLAFYLTFNVKRLTGAF